jgi:hypothetical protein
MHAKLCSENMKGQYDLEDQGVDGRVMELFLKRIHEVQYRDHLQVLVDTVMNLLVP